MLLCLTVAACGSNDSGTNDNSAPDQRCLLASGGAAATCVRQYAAAIGACRNAADAACEAALRGKGGRLAALLAATEEPVRSNCAADDANKLTFLLGIDDLVSRTAQACQKWGADLVAVTYAADLAGRPLDELACQRVVGTQLAGLHDAVVQAYGPGCYVAEFNGRRCDRAGRDRQVAQARTRAAAAIEQACGPAFDALDLVPLTASPTLTGRIGALMDVVTSRARHLAQRVYPPLNLGSTGLFGPSPVGVRTFNLVDPSRLNVAGTAPRPVKVEVYYPSTLDAVASAPRDIVELLGATLMVTPTYRDVPRVRGRFPLVLFSPGSNSDPWEYVYLAAHLASHGFLVASVEHHGEHLLDTSDPDARSNRPRDLSFVVDQLLDLNAEPDSFFASAIDADRIGAAGHSFGGYAALAVATCPLSTFDVRFKAIFPIEGAVQIFSSQAPGIFSTIAIPTLLVGGSASGLAPVLQTTFDGLTSGPTVSAYATLVDASHNTFSDACELPDTILRAFTGGPLPDCEPESLPWRYARHITNYLALNFFDATLNGRADALARLDPAVLAAIEEMTYQSQAGDCPPGDSCGATCTLPCGNGIVEAREACDTPGEQGVCPPGEACNTNCTACVNCADATLVAPEGGTFVGTTVGGKTVLSSSCGLDVLSPGRLFQWTPAVSHVATIETCGGTTDFDTTLFVREDTCFGPDLACSDDACGVQSHLTLPVVTGTTYFIIVDGFIAQAGKFTLSVF
jgi:predicted dienelactone hydrolase